MNLIAEGLKATLLLCDFAQEVGGKLYIVGGGFSKAISWGQPINMALAVKLDVPWHAANTKLKFVLALLTEDGRVVHAPDGTPIRADGEFEVGRPPGLTAGTSLDAAMAIPMFGLPLVHGAYRWEFRVQGELAQTAGFEVVPPPPGFPVPALPRRPELGS